MLPKIEKIKQDTELWRSAQEENWQLRETDFKRSRAETEQMLDVYAEFAVGANGTILKYVE